MLRSYLKIALRNLFRNKVFSFINIVGLSIGLACCLLIFLYTKDELSYDRFQQKSKQLYLVTCRIINKEEGRDTKYGMAGMIEGPSFKKQIPEVKEFVRVREDRFVLKKGTETFDQKAVWADENFFQIFSFPLIAGDPKKVLSDPHSVVLTDETAKKYFGSTNPVGKTLELEINKKFESFIVSGIARRSPENSSVKFDMLLSFKYQEAKGVDDNWLFLSYSTFLLLDPRADAGAVAMKMNKVFETSSKEQIAEARKHGFAAQFIWGVQPFLKMHLDTEVERSSIKDSSKPIYSYILSGIAFFILLIACINFVNLTVAQSLKRSKEIGLRKVVGGMRGQLIRQFMGESFLLCFIAFALAIVLAGAILPLFNELANKRLSLSYLLDLPLAASFVGLFLLTGFAAGFYPALVLSGFNPVETLYNRMHTSGKNYLSKGLVVVQFALATFLIIATLFVYSQYDYLTHMDLGYNDKNLLSVNITGQSRNRDLLRQFESEFTALSGVRSVGMKMDGRWVTGARAGGKSFDVDYDNINENYLPTLGVPVILGRNFSKDFPSDSTHSVVVNESFVSAAGWKDPIGKTLDFINGKDVKMIVVGVVKDYHYTSLKEKIIPQVFFADNSDVLGRFLLRLQPDNTARTLKAIEGVYQTLLPWHPFQHSFVEEANLKNYDAEGKWKQIITYSAILTIFISCIGLFGLAMLSIRKRTKEIGIRKVLGASIWQISGLVSKNFIGLVIFAFLIAIPAAWYATSRWLENFPYRIPVNGWVFAIAALLTLLVAALTVGFHALRAAGANPVKSLRTE
ncbi:MAG TPA: ABC transporter permease [Puia sp.]|nr:ABC transporter permease [Puia sp.]